MARVLPPLTEEEKQIKETRKNEYKNILAAITER